MLTKDLFVRATDDKGLLKSPRIIMFALSALDNAAFCYINIFIFFPFFGKVTLRLAAGSQNVLSFDLDSHSARVSKISRKNQLGIVAV